MRTLAIAILVAASACNSSSVPPSPEAARCIRFWIQPQNPGNKEDWSLQVFEDGSGLLSVNSYDPDVLNTIPPVQVPAGTFDLAEDVSRLMPELSDIHEVKLGGHSYWVLFTFTDGPRAYKIASPSPLSKELFERAYRKGFEAWPQHLEALRGNVEEAWRRTAPTFSGEKPSGSQDASQPK